jgi:dihydroflavonol-4-reductase
MEFPIFFSQNQYGYYCMKCFVTGASGFVGSNLVHELLARGHRVKALLRPNADERALAGARFERVTGDILDRKLLLHEMEGCDWCFHVAASYHLWLRNYQPMYEANVEGTRNVLEAAGKNGCRRIVYTSTVGCIGLPKIENTVVIPATEQQIISQDQLTNHYKRSKWQAEEVAVKLVRDGLPVVIVNPSAPVGPWDAKPTPTGRIILDFLNRKLPAYIETGLNWVHVRDVAIGHILAAERGVIGERYILGNMQGNWTMEETLRVLQEITGIPAAHVKIPRWIALAAAYTNEAFAKVTGIPPRVPLAGVRMAKHRMWFKPTKAVLQLSMPQTPPKQALADAVEWFRANGYARKQ